MGPSLYDQTVGRCWDPPLPDADTADAAMPELIARGPSSSASTGAPAEPTHPSRALPLPGDLGVPTMLVPAEVDYLHYLAASCRGEGRIVELGCCLGGSTAALHAGALAGRRGAARGHAPLLPIITHDAFVAPTHAAGTKAGGFAAMGIRPGENFLPRYAELHSLRLKDLTVRPGFIPDDADAAACRTLYPEQDPVELLFVDVAKTWGVHLTVLRAFASHLVPGGHLVQQDFKDPYVPWIPLHMWQLRSVFEPVHNIHAGATVTFRCRGNPEPALAGLWRAADLADPARREAAWHEAESYWAAALSPEAALITLWHRAWHELHANNPARAAFWLAEFVRRFTPERAAPGPARLAGRWRMVLDGVLLRAEHGLPDTDERRHFIAEVNRLRSTPLAGEFWWRSIAPADAPAHLRSLAESLRRAGHRRIALFGAGRHTARLLREGWPAGLLEVDCVLDDAPAAAEIAGVPVVSPASLAHAPRRFTAVLPSSDAYEPIILRRAQAVFAGAAVEVVPMYFLDDPRTREVSAA